MTEQDLETLARPPVANITLPVRHSTYLALKPNMRIDPDGPAPRYPVEVSGIETLGRWIVVGLREDFSLAGNRMYWVTLEWTER